ncbi:ABC1 kinase family protein [Candidatus Nanohalococcus occultus]|uniref:ABC1 kinase family protein n=1 Tax=Candidatus Nanohalococcus occultus TaxID=2978047 RepID=UPI0039E1D4AB
MNRISKDIEDIERLEEIVEEVAHHGFNILIKKLDLESHLHFHYRVMSSDVNGPEEFRELLEELGTVFIKLGQILAERPDLVPENYRKELEKLEYDVEKIDYSRIEEIIEEEIGLEKFDSIDEEPLASASIAQVHRAKYNGEDVVLKVRKPGIKEVVERDLDILEKCADYGGKHIGKMKSMSVLKFVKEFSGWTRQELDFEREAENAKLFKENTADDEKIKVPEVYGEVSTKKVLTLEYVEGVKCTDLEKLEELDIDTEEIAATAVRAGMKQSIRDGFYHADPHPSNFLITEEGELVYLDFGMMGSISQDQSRKLGLMLLYLIRENSSDIVDVMEDLGTVSNDYNRAGVEQVVEQKTRVLSNSSLKQVSVTKEMFDLFVKASENGLQMPSSLTLMGKSLVTTEGIGLTICPDFRITDEYEETAEDLLKQQNSPEDIAKDFSIDLIKNKDLIAKLPSKINRALKTEQKQPVKVIQEDNSNDHIMPAALLIGATVLFYQVLPAEQMAVIGALEMLAAVYLLR